MLKNMLERFVPAAMKRAKSWCVYRTEAGQDGALSKRIINPYNGKWASCNEPRDHTYFSIALKQAERYGADGIAFALSAEAGIVCVDVDDCISDGVVSAPAKKIVSDFLGTYIEISPSGCGLHIFAYADIPQGAGKKNSAAGIELYGKSRFISMTGNSFNSSSELRHHQSAVNDLCAKYLRREPAAYPSLRDVKISGDSAGGLCDEQLILRISQSRQGEKFERLMSGECAYRKFDGSPDYSAADMSLCCVLAFWTKDFAQIDRIFRLSKLYSVVRSGDSRPKWDKSVGSGSYGSLTIQNALICVTASRASTYLKKS